MRRSEGVFEMFTVSSTVLALSFSFKRKDEVDFDVIEEE